jgi:chlorite dismutase
MSDSTIPHEHAVAATERPAGAGPPPGVAARGASAGDGAPDLREHGAPLRGVPQTSTRRLFVQLHVFTECPPPNGIIAEVRRSGLDAVVYADLNDPRGIGVLLMSEDPALFAEDGRRLLSNMPFSSLKPRPEMTMIGRTYSSGREADLEDFLLRKVPRNVLGPEHPWAVWYPLRRIGAFNQLPRAEQGKILMEHGMLGRRYGEAGHAVDVRLECHGLDRDDNEFVIGLIGPQLHPLSRLVKDMRATRQTSEFIQQMGPFFVGKALYQAPLPGAPSA